MDRSEIKYGGFWKRLASGLLDILILLPITAPALWLGTLSRMLHIGTVLPLVLVHLWYNVHLVKKYGGTPGKRLMNLRIKTILGKEIGYKEAFLRYLVQFDLHILSTVAFCIGILAIPDSQYASLGFNGQAKAIYELQPIWGRWVGYALNTWGVAEFVVILTNSKRRALHDFMAGTVVVDESRQAL